MDTTRLWAAGAALGLLAVPVAPAAAVERLAFEEPWNETIACGDVVGAARGTVIQRVHLYDHEDGRVHLVLSERVSTPR